MQYIELKRMIDQHIIRTSEDFPQSAFTIAQSLNLRLKNSAECKQDYKDQYPLYDADAVLARCYGEYTIYYDENHAYHNFFIAHEIAHYILGHDSESMSNDHDAQIAAAIIVAPVNLVHKYHIKSATQLSEQCKIPINIAILYWDEIQSQTKFSIKDKPFKSIYVAILAVTIAICATQTYIMLCPTKENFPSTAATEPPIQRIIPTTYPTISPANTAPESTEHVYITPSGKKYHVANCRHIRSSEVVELSIDEATALDKEPCGDCIK